MELARYFFHLDGHPVIIEISKHLPPPRVEKMESGAQSQPTTGVVLPAFVNQRRPSTVTVNGQARKLSAAVAILLDAKRRGGKHLRARPDTLRRLAAELPEFAGFVKRVGKCTGGMIPVILDGDWVG